MFYGGIIFNFFGAAVRWIYGSIWRTIANKKKYIFKEYMYGPEDSDEWFDMKGHSFVNRIIGMIAIGTICWIILELGL